MLVEADGAAALSRGMHGLGVRLARRINTHLGRSGRVFARLTPAASHSARGPKRAPLCAAQRPLPRRRARPPPRQRLDRSIFHRSLVRQLRRFPGVNARPHRHHPGSPSCARCRAPPRRRAPGSSPPAGAATARSCPMTSPVDLDARRRRATATSRAPGLRGARPAWGSGRGRVVLGRVVAGGGEVHVHHRGVLVAGHAGERGLDAGGELALAAAAHHP
jgi:hypothetical protein